VEKSSSPERYNGTAQQQSMLSVILNAVADPVHARVAERYTGGSGMPSLDGAVELPRQFAWQAALCADAVFARSHLLSTGGIAGEGSFARLEGVARQAFVIRWRRARNEPCPSATTAGEPRPPRSRASYRLLTPTGE